MSDFENRAYASPIWGKVQPLLNKGTGSEFFDVPEVSTVAVICVIPPLLAWESMV